MEAEAVVHGEDRSVGGEETVTGLPVGVVGDDVEYADPLEARVVRGVVAEGEVVLLEVGRDEELERALAVGPLAAHRRRHEPPAERLRQLIRRQLAREEARRKVPEWPLAAPRLVDGEPGGAVELEFGEERRVRAGGHATAQRDPAAREQGVRERCGHSSAGTRGRPDPWAECRTGRRAGPP